LRVPKYLHEAVPTGKILHETSHVIDLMPTFLEIAEVSYLAAYKGRPVASLDGRSLLPVMKEGRRTGDRVLLWESFGHRAVRQGGWKLVRGREGSSGELYNIAEDRTERHDLAARACEKVRGMSQAWQAWADSAGVIMDPNGPWLRG
jgi:arylsulfatase A-like enzyme